MLALLFLFMPGPPVHPKGSSVDMVVAQQSTQMPGALKDDAMVISVSRDGNVFFREVRISLAELPDEIHKSVQNGAENRIYLKADARSKYLDTKQVLDQIRLAGVEKVSLLAESPR